MLHELRGKKWYTKDYLAGYINSRSNSGVSYIVEFNEDTREYDTTSNVLYEEEVAIEMMTITSIYEEGYTETDDVKISIDSLGIVTVL